MIGILPFKKKYFKHHLKRHQQQMDDPGGVAMTTASEDLWSIGLAGNSVRGISDEHC